MNEETINTATEAAVEAANNGNVVLLAVVGGMLLGAAALKAFQLTGQVIRSRRDKWLDDFDEGDESESVTVNPNNEENND